MVPSVKRLCGNFAIISQIQKKTEVLYNLTNIVLILSLKYLGWGKIYKGKMTAVLKHNIGKDGGGEPAKGIYISPAGKMLWYKSFVLCVNT